MKKGMMGMKKDSKMMDKKMMDKKMPKAMMMKKSGKK